MKRRPVWFSKPTCEAMTERGKGTMSDHLGISFVAIGDDFITGRMPVDHRTKQPVGSCTAGLGSSCRDDRQHGRKSGRRYQNPLLRGLGDQRQSRPFLHRGICRGHCPSVAFRQDDADLGDQNHSR